MPDTKGSTTNKVTYATDDGEKAGLFVGKEVKVIGTLLSPNSQERMLYCSSWTGFFTSQLSALAWVAALPGLKLCRLAQLLDLGIARNR